MIRCTTLFCLIILLGLEGCNFLGPQKVPEQTTYTLAVPKSAPQQSHSQKTTLLVSTPTAGPGYESRKMRFTSQRFELSEFAKNQWAAPPAEMLAPILIQKLRDTGHFHAVLSDGFGTKRQLLLKTHLIELQQDFTCKPSRVQLGIQAELINTETNKVLNSKTFRLSVVAPQDTPYSGVVATNRAVDRLTTQIAEFCIRSLTQ